MKVVKLNEDAYILRHWRQWYLVKRPFKKWEKIEVVIRQKQPKETTIDSVLETLPKADPIDFNKL